jgi:hypothetical protein
MIINLLLICIVVTLSTSLGFNIISNNIRVNRINLNMNTNSDPLLLRAARGK